jgi:hypothetical protein
MPQKKSHAVRRGGTTPIVKKNLMWPPSPAIRALAMSDFDALKIKQQDQTIEAL